MNFIQKYTAETLKKENVSTLKLCKEITDMLQKVNKKIPQKGFFALNCPNIGDFCTIFLSIHLVASNLCIPKIENRTEYGSIHCV